MTDRLLGGLDLAATLSAGRPVAQAGLMAEADGGLIVVPMAERLSPGTAARLAGALDTGSAVGRPARFGLILLDEGAEDETVPDALADRLAFRIDLTAIGLGDRGVSLPVADEGVAGATTGSDPAPPSRPTAPPKGEASDPI